MIFFIFFGILFFYGTDPITALVVVSSIIEEVFPFKFGGSVNNFVMNCLDGVHEADQIWIFG